MACSAMDVLPHQGKVLFSGWTLFVRGVVGGKGQSKEYHEKEGEQTAKDDVVFSSENHAGHRGMMIDHGDGVAVDGSKGSAKRGIGLE